MFTEKVFINRNLGIKFRSFIDEECCVWFHGKEVAKILGYKKTRNAIEKHVSKKYKKEAPVQGPLGGEQKCIIIKEAGSYDLAFKSRLPTAKMFREWVFDKVLPSIRKYGYYRMFDSRIKQRVKIEGKKYFKHPVFSNYAANKNGEVINVKTGRIIRMSKSGNGYLKFNLSNKKKLEKTISYSNHRFVFEVFKGPIPKCLETDHINGIKTDNRIKNLQLLTHKQNIPKSNNKAIISTCIETGKEIRFKSLKKASIELDINVSYISDICRKKMYCKTATSKRDGCKYTFKFMD